MDQQRAPMFPPLGDGDLDDAPGLTPRDETALDVIRRQLAEEYSNVDTPSLVVGDAAVSAPSGAAGARRTRGWLLVAVLVALGAVGGGAVGAVLTVHVLDKPEAGVASGVPPGPLPEGAAPPQREAEIVPPSLPPRWGTGSAAGVALAPAPTRRPGPAEPRAGSDGPAATMAASRPVTGTPPPGPPASTRVDPPATRPAPPAASPSTSPAPREPLGSTPIAGPEPQGWSDPFQPLSAETEAHAGVAKAAFRSPAVSPVPPPAPPPTGQPLAAPRAVAEPAMPAPRPEADPAAKPQGPSREDGLLTTIRDDWETVKHGFASAPDDFREAWRSLTRDLKGLLER